MAHYDDESLFAYVEGTSSASGEIESHVTGCAECADEVREQRRFIAVLGDASVWERQVAPAAPPAIAAFADRVFVEDDEAAALCDQILTGPHTWWAQRLRQSARAATAGVVKQLLGRMRTLLETSPAAALQVTSLALEIAGALAVTAYPSDFVIRLRAQAARDHAYVLSFMGRYPEALEFAERSLRLFEQVPLPQYDLARLALVRAAILQHVDRTSEAAALAHEAGETFLQFGDRTRYVNARITEGAVVYNSGAIERALEIWKSIEHDPALDEVGAVRVAHNIAICCSDLGRAEEAVEYLTHCVAQFDLLGMDTERTRSRWKLAAALVASGNVREAVPALRRTWREFTDLEMTADAGLAALELAEALLAAGDVHEVPSICREVITQFTRAGMASRAITALSFLREAVAVGQASTSLIRHVHAFLRQLPAEQPRLFAAPPPGAGE